MTRAAVIAAAVALLSTAAGGCTHVRTFTAPGPPAQASGVLRISGFADPTSLNPMLTGADIAYQLSGLVLEYLVQLDDRGNVAPVLCDRVPSLANGGISADGLTVTYHLRRGVRWSDGEPLTSADVVASWKQVMNPLNNVVDREGYEEIVRIDTPDRLTAVLHLAHPYPPMPTRFFAGIQEAPIPVMPAHIIARLRELNDAPFSAHPVGTGPFVLQSWIRNGPMTFVANQHYWRGAVGLREIVYQAQPSTASEMVGFKTDEIDADFDAGGQRMPEYAGLAGMHALVSPSLRLYVLDMDAGRDPLRDPHVRRAVAYAIDRASILHRVQHDDGSLADEWLPAWSWAHSAAVPHYGFDPRKAASILETDGWILGSDGVRRKNGARLSLLFVGPQGDGAFKAASELIQAYLNGVGFDVTIKLFPYGIVYDPAGPVKTGHFDLAFYNFSVNYDPSALDYDGCDRFPPKGVNDERYCDPTVDREERLSLLTNDPKRRKALFAEIERKRLEDLSSLPMYFPDRVGVISNRLHGYAPSRGIIPEWDVWRWTMQ